MELNTSGMITLLNKTMFHREFPPSNEIKSVPRGTDKIQNTRDIIEEAVKTTNYFLAKKSKGSGRNIKLRVASRSDADHVLNLVKGLASFEKAVEEVIVSSNTYRRDGCGVKNPIFHCILVESLNDESNSSQIVGMGLFYFGYSALHGGRYLFLEDLFIEKQYRGLGCGTYMLSCLAEISLKTGCFRFVWQVLDWNVSAIEFYKTIGATMCTDLITLRLNYDRICESAIQFTSMQCNE
jgi:Acetyltransferases